MRNFAMLFSIVAWSGSVFAGLLVTDLVGKVEFETKGAIKVLGDIPEGARFTLAEGARLVAVDLVTGNEYSLRGPEQFTVGMDGPRNSKGTQVEAKPVPVLKMGNVRIAPAKVAQATLVMRGIHKVSGVVLESPVRTAVVTPMPRMVWLPVIGAANYHVVILDDQRRQLYEATVTGSELIVPAVAGLVNGGRYKWRVEAIGQQDSFADAAAEFSVIPAENAETLAKFKPNQKAPYARRVLYAALLQDAGARDEARIIWKALAAERPEDEVVADLAK